MMNRLGEFWQKPNNGPQARQQVVDYFNFIGKTKTTRRSDIAQAELEIDTPARDEARERRRCSYPAVETRIAASTQQLQAFLAILLATGVGWVVVENGQWQLPSIYKTPQSNRPAPEIRSYQELPLTQDRDPFAINADDSGWRSNGRYDEFGQW